MVDFTNKIINFEDNTITYEELGASCKKILYPVYCEKEDITVIFQDTVDKNNEDMWYKEVVGFYFGQPDINLIEEYEGKLKACFE